MSLELIFLGLVAAFIGIVLMTIGQEIEIRLNKRPISYTPAIAVFKILRLNFDRLSARMKGIASYAVHFGYGTFFGILLAALYAFGVTEFYTLLAIYYVFIVVQGWVVVPALGIAGPPWTWGLKPVLTEMAHKVVYSVVAVYVFFQII